VNVEKFNFVTGFPTLEMPGHDAVTRSIAAAAMRDEHMRSKGGFNNPSTQQPIMPNSSLYNIPSPSGNNVRKPNHQFQSSSNSAQNQQNQQQQHNRQQQQQQQNLFNPTAETVPNAVFPGGFDTANMGQLGQFLQLVQLMASTAVPPAANTSKDPETKMAKNLEDLRANPVLMPAG
jgi:hypothetical protein